MEGLSKDMIKSLLKDSGPKKHLTHLTLSGKYPPTFSQDDILEIAPFLPVIQVWGLMVKGSTLTVKGAKEWINSCPDLSKAFFKMNRLSFWGKWAIYRELVAASTAFLNDEREGEWLKDEREGECDRHDGIPNPSITRFKSGTSKEVMQVFDEKKIHIN